MRTRLKSLELGSTKFALKRLMKAGSFVVFCLVMVGVLLIIHVTAMAQDYQEKIPKRQMIESTDRTTEGTGGDSGEARVVQQTPIAPFGNVPEAHVEPKSSNPENEGFRLFPRDSGSVFFEKWQPDVPQNSVPRSEKVGQNPFGGVVQDLNRNPFGNTPERASKNPFGGVAQ